MSPQQAVRVRRRRSASYLAYSTRVGARPRKRKRVCRRCWARRWSGACLFDTLSPAILIPDLFCALSCSNLVLAARVRELEMHKSVAASAAVEASAFGLAPSNGGSSARASIADTLFASQVRPRHSQLLRGLTHPPCWSLQTPAPPARSSTHSGRASVPPAKEVQTPAPSLPALDPMSPFVLDRTVRRGERHAAAGKGGLRPLSGLRE